MEAAGGAPAPPRARRSGRNVAAAIVTGVVLAGLLVATLFIDVWAFVALAAVAVAIAELELFHVFARQRGIRAARSLAVACSVIVLAMTAWRGIASLTYTLVGVVVATFLWHVVDPERERAAESLAVTIFGIVYVAVFCAHVVAMLELPHGSALTLAFFLLGVGYDVGAYASGATFGKHPMAPKISPSKTWEGAAGATALVFVLALGVAAPLTPVLTATSAAALGLIVVVFSPMGDLAESLVKRDLGVKDMGGLLPGHGGMLDRIDGLLFAAPIAYWYLRALTR